MTSLLTSRTTTTMAAAGSLMSYNNGNDAMPAFTFLAARDIVRGALGFGHRKAPSFATAARHYGDAGTDGLNPLLCGGLGWVICFNFWVGLDLETA
jgi:hypothetical protein